MRERPRVLLVVHDASRTGAPIAALTLLRWLVASDLADPSVLFLAGGPLAPDFARIAPTRTPATGLASWLDRIARCAESLSGSALALRRIADRAQVRGLGRTRPEVVVANSVAAWPAAAVAADANDARLVCWVHELDHVAERLLQGRDRCALVARTDQFLAAGRRVATMLVDRWEVPVDRVVVVAEPVESLAPAQAPQVGPARSSGGPGARPRRVLGVGTGVPRKGVDAFVAAVAVLARDRPDLDAAWVGIDPSSPLAREAAADAADAALSAVLRLRPPVDDLAAEWAATALLVHTAREDPCPLVVVEAAQRGVPTITWDTGGAADLLRDAGLGHLVAPAGDLLGLAERTERLLDDEPARRAAGESLRAQALRHDVSVVGPLAWSAIRGSSPGPGPSTSRARAEAVTAGSTA